MLCLFLQGRRPFFRTMLTVLALVSLVLRASSSNPDIFTTSCDFETSCAWQWNDTIQHGFRLVTGQEVDQPSNDASNNTHGEYDDAVN